MRGRPVLRVFGSVPGNHITIIIILYSFWTLERLHVQNAMLTNLLFFKILVQTERVFFELIFCISKKAHLSFIGIVAVWDAGSMPSMDVPLGPFIFCS